LTALDGAPLTAWELLQQALEERPEEAHRLAWRAAADGTTHEGAFHLDRRRQLDECQSESTLYVFGAETARAIRPVPEVTVEARPVHAVAHGVGRAIGVTVMMVRVLWRTLLGELPATALGGPILLYQVAGVAAQHGAEQFLAMAALVSLNLGLLNLL